MSTPKADAAMRQRYGAGVRLAKKRFNKMIKFKRRSCVFATRDKILKFSELELKTRAEAKRSKTATKTY